jgi:hypothetical protein
MPKTEIDYSNTIIYKITCKSPHVNDVYIGYTTNFVQRKYLHKSCCINNKYLAHDTCRKLYTTILNNGGWTNWDMEKIITLNCKDHYEAIQKEQEYIISLSATLNDTTIPIINTNLDSVTNDGNEKTLSFHCNKCNLTFVTEKIFILHKNKHKFAAEKQKSVFICKICDYNTCKKSSYDKHLTTNKHLNGKQLPEKLLKGCPKVAQNFECKCGKKYKYDSGFCRHKQKCTHGVCIPTTDDKELITMLLKQNNELLTLIKNGATTTNITQTNSNNKTFNLQFFLNEQCKDALNISDFVTSIKPQLIDLEKTGRLGYVEGVSRIINKNLNELDTFMRPIHCSDLKRNTLYIKDDNQWQKENENNPILTKAIKYVANENIKQISEWKKVHPDCTDSESKQNTLYLNIVSNAMSGGTREEQTNNYNKIISNIAKEVVIDKS